jgi:hypothetical protein
LLTITATAITHRAAPDQNANHSFCLEPSGFKRADQKFTAYRGFYRVFYRVPADGAAAHQTGRIDALLHRRRHPSPAVCGIALQTSGRLYSPGGIPVGLATCASRAAPSQMAASGIRPTARRRSGSRLASHPRIGSPAHPTGRESLPRRRPRSRRGPADAQAGSGEYPVPLAEPASPLALLTTP